MSHTVQTLPGRAFLTLSDARQFLKRSHKLILIASLSIVAFIFANVSLDFLFTRFQHSDFYISESFLFSSFWLLYLPLLSILFLLTRRAENLPKRISLAACLVGLHLIAYPALVWSLSKIFYYHTFAYWQTFNYGLSAYSLGSVLTYGLSLLLFTNSWKKPNEAVMLPGHPVREVKGQTSITSIVAADSVNKKTILAVHDIDYFTANTPYIKIHHTGKTYLHSDSLRSLEDKLDNSQFVRIHKSHIVNLGRVAFYHSRRNGDYDITLSNGTVLRVSRNYAQDFKSKLRELHHVALK